MGYGLTFLGRNLHGDVKSTPEPPYFYKDGMIFATFFFLMQLFSLERHFRDFFSYPKAFLLNLFLPKHISNSR